MHNACFAISALAGTFGFLLTLLGIMSMIGPTANELSEAATRVQEAKKRGGWLARLDADADNRGMIWNSDRLRRQWFDNHTGRKMFFFGLILLATAAVALLLSNLLPSSGV